MVAGLINLVAANVPEVLLHLAGRRTGCRMLLHGGLALL